MTTWIGTALLVSEIWQAVRGAFGLALLAAVVLPKEVV